MHLYSQILSTNSMEHSPFREVNSSIDSQKFSAFCRIYRFNTMFGRACHSSCLEQEEPRPHHLSLRYSVILSLHIHLGRPSCFFPDEFMYTVHKLCTLYVSSKTDHIFCIRQILEKKWEYNEAVHQLSVDFKKAYDSVRREVLYNILIEFWIPRKLVRLIKMCLTETYSRVWVGKNF